MTACRRSVVSKYRVWIRPETASHFEQVVNATVSSREGKRLKPDETVSATRPYGTKQAAQEVVLPFLSIQTLVYLDANVRMY